MIERPTYRRVFFRGFAVLLMFVGAVTGVFGPCLNIYRQGFGDEGPNLTVAEDKWLHRASVASPFVGLALLIGAGAAVVMIDRKRAKRPDQPTPD